ncbi:MAG: DUF1549 and DUF1553 domain-containing protein [Limisphaerales bacterium]
MNARLFIALLLFAVGVHAAEVEHWSFQPLKRPLVPSGSSSGRSVIDAFIDAELRTRGLARSEEAAPTVLIRRLHYLLTGLPPTPEQVASFEREPQYELWVERLLNSPAYGERWARHWLDVVRFAETHGFEMNQPRDSAWKYRDYVIRAFNNDTPYDQFVREQIAGDVFGEDDATGFLVAGPWDQVKSPDPVLTANQRADELHDIVSTTGSALLGLTVGCARCHDHKFDPIPQEDYFAIKAVFEGVEHGERARADRVGEQERARIAELRRQVREMDEAIDALEPLARLDVTNAHRAAVNARRNVDRFMPSEAKRLRFTILKSSDAEPCIDELEVYTPDSENVALAVNGTKANASGTYPNSEIHRLEHINDGRHGNSRSWISNERGTGWVELEFSRPITITKVIWGRDREERFKDRLALEYRIEVATGESDYQLIASSSDRFASEDVGKMISPEIPRLVAKRAGLVSRVAELEKKLLVYAGKFNPEPGPTYRLHRGDPMLKREVVAPGPLQAVGIAFKECSDTKLTTEQQRRVAFAEWVTDPKNPLTARVMVNRIWQYHFGAGLVSTPSDFGVNGARPTHPDLLDWLATEFIEKGWSVKHIQRLILTSATFRQGNATHARGMELDANNRLLWRFEPRRLEAEAIRDSILTVSGTLTAQQGGPGFNFFEANDNYVRVYQPRVEWGRETFRRMIYGTIVRQRPDGVFGAFDCPDAGQITPRRTSSTTPLQALNLLNSSFIMQQSRLMAERLGRECGNDTEKVRRAFLLAFQREPSEGELKAGRELAASEGFGMLCRALLNANEFLYLY